MIYILNPNTGRRVKRAGATGRKVIRQEQIRAGSHMRNPLTGRTVKVGGTTDKKIKKQKEVRGVKVNNFLVKKLTNVSVKTTQPSINGNVNDYTLTNPQLSRKDIHVYLSKARASVEYAILKEMRKHRGIKFNLSLMSRFEITGYLRDLPVNSKMKDVQNVSQLQDMITESYNNLMINMDNLVTRGSGLKFMFIKSMTVHVVKHNALNGSSYVDLPKFVKDKKACINIKNYDDDECFKWCLLAHQIIKDESVHDKTKLELVNKLKKYQNNKYDFSKVDFPMKINKIKSFEKLNNMSINIYMCENKSIYPVQICELEKKDHVDLLLHNGHYVYIKNFSRLVSMQTSSHKTAKFFCKRCLHGFYKTTTLEDHITNGCMNMDSAKVVMPIKGENDSMKFKNYKFMDKHPYVIYADFESVLEEGVDLGNKYKVHKAASYCYYIVSSDNQIIKPRIYKGHNVVQTFLKNIREDVNVLCENMKNVEPMIMTDEDKQIFTSSEVCRFCQEGDFTGVNPKVRDHDHITGKFRGAAHMICNSKASIPKRVPIYLHNMKGYDSHLIIKGFNLEDNKTLNVIANTAEKYSSITIDNFEFKDSFSFMSTSLEKLAENLDADSFNHVATFWNDEEKSKLVTMKGVFPYSWFDSLEKMQDEELPSIEDFNNDLNGQYDVYEGNEVKAIEECELQSITQKQYEHAQNIWTTFDCKTFGDYHDVYLYTDVLLLADIFENFRNMCLSYYGLDPAHYLTAPSLSWDALLKMTKINLELLTDYDMYLMIEQGIRGGISMISNRYAKANNKYMKNYDNKEITKYLMYLDANNLYGHSMSEKLPTNNFNWANVDDPKFSEWIHNSEEEIDHQGYFFEVDLEYPKELHDLHNDYPLAPERLVVKNEMLSEYQNAVINELNIKSIECVKLVPNLNNKVKYQVHYKVLKLYLLLGLKITKIHRIISFDHSCWMKQYIDFNTAKRTVAKNDFEKDFFKLMNNSVFGKTMENVRNRINFHLVSDEKKLVRLTNKPNFKKHPKIFSDNLIGVELEKVTVTLNKPIYVGMAILDNSKHLMYDYHYNHMLPKYGNKCKLLFTDTDSLCYSIETEDVYADMKQDSDMYDFSGYDKNHYLYDVVNKKVIGKMKDELNGKIMTEFVGIRPKVYAYVKESEVDDKKCKGLKRVISVEDKKCKGVKRVIRDNKITFDQYKKCIFENRVYKCGYNNFTTKNHQIYSTVNNKICLSPLDTKRYLINSTDSFAIGHYGIPK